MQLSKPKIKKGKRKKSRKKSSPIKLKSKWAVNDGDIYLFWAEDQFTLTMTFLRIQEFYESSLIPIKGRKFDLEKYMDLYAEKFGNFSYTEDWCGFNIPDVEFAKFYKMYNVGEMSRKETHLLKLIGPAVKDYYIHKKRFCVIGAYRAEDIPHETAHGLFHLDSNYRADMKEMVDSWKGAKKFGKLMEEMGYSNSQFYDECQAYLATSNKSFLKSMGYWGDWDITKKFKGIFNSYKKLWGIEF